MTLDVPAREEITPDERKVLMDRIIGRVRRYGMLSSGCLGVVSYDVADKWLQRDVDGFEARFEAARNEYKGWLQTRAADLVADLKNGQSPQLLTMLLAAEFPDIYGKAALDEDLIASARNVAASLTKATKAAKRVDAAEDAPKPGKATRKRRRRGGPVPITDYLPNASSE